VQDPEKVELIKKDNNNFNNSGIAVAAIKGKNKRETLVSVMAGDLNLYDSQKIKVVAQHNTRPENSSVEPQESKGLAAAANLISISLNVLPCCFAMSSINLSIFSVTELKISDSKPIVPIICNLNI
jgi:hypothetical protein